jgi:hypothetical protein
VDVCTNIPGAQQSAPEGRHQTPAGSCELDVQGGQDASTQAPAVCNDVILGQPQSDEAIAKCLDESTKGSLRGFWAFLQIFRWPLVAGILAAFVTILVTKKDEHEYSKGFLAFWGASAAVFVLGSTLWGLVTLAFDKIGFHNGWPPNWVIPVDEVGNPFEFIIVGGAIVLAIAAIAALTWYKRFGQAVAVGIVSTMLWGGASHIPQDNIVKWTNHAVYKVFYPHAGTGNAQIDALLAKQADEAKARAVIFSSR